MKVFEHEKFGKVEIAELTTKQYEDYSELLKNGDRSFVKFKVDTVKAFLELGLAKCEPELDAKGVDSEKPARTMWLAEQITNVIAEAITIDPLA